MKRRRNPVSAGDWVFYGALAGGAFLLYRWFTTPGGPPGTQTISSWLASLISKVTLPAPIVVNTGGRNVAMPDGSSVPLASFMGLQSNSNGSPTLTGSYAGTAYTIDSDGQGNYFAY